MTEETYRTIHAELCNCFEETEAKLAALQNQRHSLWEMPRLLQRNRGICCNYNRKTGGYSLCGINHFPCALQSIPEGACKPGIHVITKQTTRFSRRSDRCSHDFRNRPRDGALRGGCTSHWDYGTVFRKQKHPLPHLHYRIYRHTT